MLARVWTDEDLRRELVEKGSRVAASLSWTRIGALYRALYRRVAGEPPTEEEAELLDAARSSLSLA